MCGIIGVVVKKQRGVLSRVKSILDNQIIRGSDGGGIALKRGKRITRMRHENPRTVLKDFAKWQGFRDGDLFIFHHRYPTSTPNIAHLNHPLTDEKKRIYLIHNGHITDYEEKFDKLKSKHKFETRHKTKEGKIIITDSEVLVHILEEELSRNRLKTAFKRLAKRTKGSFAIACFLKGYNQIFLFKNSFNPIVVFKDKRGNFYFASQFPDNNGFKKIKELEQGELGVLNCEGYHKIEKFKGFKTQQIAWYYDRDAGNFKPAYIG